MAIEMKCFVLKPAGKDAYSKASIGAMLAYAESIYDFDPDLAQSLLQWAQRAVECSKTNANGMNFGQALDRLKAGGKVFREGWNGKGLWLELQEPGPRDKMTLPYIYINYPPDAKTTPCSRVPWLASQTDLLAEDWMISL